jgi:hypothetical protein
VTPIIVNGESISFEYRQIRYEWSEAYINHDSDKAN